MFNSEEKILNDIGFNVQKITPRPRQKPKDTVIFPMFSEFGSEILGVLYCIPELLKTKYQGKYSIVATWAGRKYLYEHLVDECLELKDEFQWLREYCKGFHHTSLNLTKATRQLSNFGHISDVNEQSNLATIDRCMDCGSAWTYLDKSVRCQNLSCSSRNINWSLFSDVYGSRKNRCVWLPEVDTEKLKIAKQIIPNNAVGIFARGRKCYGRNLSQEFYQQLIDLIKNMGYTPVWMGEKSTIQQCPDKDVIDFSNNILAKDMPTTIAVVKSLAFTIQYWTASTRLAALSGTPYILFESPDQLVGVGQEGYRLNLCSRNNKKKIVLCDYINSSQDESLLLDISKKAIQDIEEKEFGYSIGIVENKSYVQHLINHRFIEIGENDPSLWKKLNVN